MKQYYSIIEGTWIKLSSIQLTKDQINLLSSEKKEDIKFKNEILALIRTKEEIEVTEEKCILLTKFYNSIKPEIKEHEVYQLISIDLSEKEEGKYTGILNCRINGEHKQIRF